MPAPDADGVALPTPMVVVKLGVILPTSVSVALGSVMVAVTASVAWIVVEPDVAPAMTNGIILLLVTL